jgi:response regulator of citrate/malate metabolism
MMHDNLVFIIDDDLLQNEIHELILLKSIPNVEVKSYSSGKEALNYLDKNNDPQIIFLDVHIPGEDVTIFLKNFESKGFESDIYLMSSLPYLERPSRFSEFPVVKDFISKPLLVNKIGHLFNHYT